MSVLHLTDKDFDEKALKSDLPVLVDFWAAWCNPCKAMGPIIDEIANELDGKIKVAKVNVDEAQELASKFKVMSIPTLFIFQGGEIVEQIVGVLSKDQLIAKINAKI